MEFSERLFQALKKDDLKEFKSCMEDNPCGSLRFGRFPVLSVMYLYNARRILHAYEKSFLKHNSWQDIGEPVELSAKFRSIAGKCLRIYLNETVSPAEMLLLLDNNSRLKKVFPQTHPTGPVKQRLVEIYYVKWALQAEIVGDKIVLQRRPMTRTEKIRWLTRALCAVLCVAIAVGTPFVVNVFAPFIADGDGVLNVAKWEQIKFASNKTYALKNDVTVPSDYFVEEMNCELRGNGHTVTVSGGSVFGTINGNVTDIVFDTDGTAIADKVALTAVVENVTVNAVFDKETNENCAFFVNNNYGTIRNVTVNVSGSLSANSMSDSEDIDSYICGGIVATNNNTVINTKTYYAILQDCTANYNDFSLKGQLQADASFGGIVGKNDAYVYNCKAFGKISADTFDVAGICSENNFGIIGSTNEVDISQKSDVTGWNPLAAGIVLNNYNTVKDCQNYGNISCVSTAAAMTEQGASPCAYATGIAYQNYNNGSVTPYLISCKNFGNISATATAIDVSAAGICNATNGGIQGEESDNTSDICLNSGNVSATGTKLVDVAGIANIAYGYIYRAVNTGTISASDGEVRAGGIASLSYVSTYGCISMGDIEVTGNVCYVGGILGCSMGVVSGSSLYCGTVRRCVADCEIKVTKNAAVDSVAAVGGIVGFVEEKDVTDYNTGNHVYVGGKIYLCYFTGQLQGSNGYVGAIAGVVGKNIYLASAPDDAQENFYANMYSTSCDVQRAFGAALWNNAYESVTDIGVMVVPTEVIATDATYQAILQILSNN